MEATGVNPNGIDQMVGRKLPGVHGHYSLPTDEELLETYKKCYYELRIYEKATDKNEETKALQQRIEELSPNRQYY